MKKTYVSIAGKMLEGNEQANEPVLLISMLLAYVCADRGTGFCSNLKRNMSAVVSRLRPLLLNIRQALLCTVYHVLALN